MFCTLDLDLSSPFRRGQLSMLVALCAFNDTCLCQVIINKQTNKQILYDTLPDLRLSCFATDLDLWRPFRPGHLSMLVALYVLSMTL